jgi:hypothetical protein
MSSDPGELPELIGYLVHSSRLSVTEAHRLVHEVLGFLQDTPEDFVRRRHRALQGEGLPNAAIFERIARELTGWRFRAPAYSARQIRRMIYG